MAIHIVTKYAELSKEDKAPMGTIAHVILEKDDELHYVQVSPRENEPEWVLVETFLGTVFKDLIEHKEFVDECMRIYHNKKNNPLFNIINILSKLSK